MTKAQMMVLRDMLKRLNAKRNDLNVFIRLHGMVDILSFDDCPEIYSLEENEKYGYYVLVKTCDDDLACNPVAFITKEGLHDYSDM